MPHRGQGQVHAPKLDPQYQVIHRDSLDGGGHTLDNLVDREYAPRWFEATDTCAAGLRRLTATADLRLTG